MVPINTHFPSFRYLNPPNGNSFYRSNEVITPEPQPNQQVLSMLQSISMTLSDVQGQLAIIQEQNEQRDSTLNRLEGDIQTLKRKNEAPQDTPKSKRHRKSPCGLSVSASDTLSNITCIVVITYCTCSSVYGLFIHHLKMKISIMLMNGKHISLCFLNPYYVFL